MPLTYSADHNICVASPGHQRALCAVACLLTSDLLSLEQIFGATRHRLGKLSEGPPGPLTNKATKVAESCPHANTYRTSRLKHLQTSLSLPLCAFCVRYCASSKPCWAGPGVSPDRKWQPATTWPQTTSPLTLHTLLHRPCQASPPVSPASAATRRPRSRQQSPPRVSPTRRPLPHQKRCRTVPRSLRLLRDPRRNRVTARQRPPGLARQR